MRSIIIQGMLFGSTVRLRHFVANMLWPRLVLRSKIYGAWRRSHRLVRTAVAVSCLSVTLCFAAIAVAASTTYGNSIVKSPKADVVSIFKLRPSVVPTKQVAHTVKPPMPVLLPGCEQGNVMNIVAHQDDDILFMNPSVQQALDAGMCMETVYVTAGDAGHDSAYWTNRELGPGTAYATMTRLPDNWQSVPVVIAGHTLTARTMPDKPNLTLIFLRLPDGNLTGQGFAATEYSSLQKLRTGEVATLRSIDGANEYNDPDLINTLRGLMHTYRPSVINIPAHSPELAYGDHSDHQTVGHYADLAAKLYFSGVKTHHYLGYQSGSLPDNLTDAEAASKQQAFSAYDQRDDLICDTDRCTNGTGYEQYFGKQYEQTLP